MIFRAKITQDFGIILISSMKSSLILPKCKIKTIN